ncbi:MAG: AMP-binding protein [Brachybacterium paraconglomeratum]|nr:AMP-binding protein [Brachybacterium paraconglomeratum]
MKGVRLFWLGLDAAWTAWRGPGAIEGRQRVRLEALVHHARSASPYFRRLYRELPSRVTDVTLLPPTHKPDLMDHFDEWLTDPDVTLSTLRRDFLGDPLLVGARYLGRYHVVTTSGTTGEPAVIVHDFDSWAVQNLVGRRYEPRILGTPRMAGAVLRRGVRAAVLAATGGHFAGPALVGAARRTWPVVAPRLRLVSVLRPLHEIVEELNDFRPTMLLGYPSVVRLLAAEQRTGHLRVEPFVAILAGEDLPPEARTEIEEAFGCRVLERYAASEALGIAASCWLGALHVNSDWYLVEPVDEDHRPVAAGTFSHTVLVTNLANRVQPVIRYDLGDRVEVDPSPCPCGLPFPVIRVRGRETDVLSFEGVDGAAVQIPPLALVTVIEETPGVSRCQAIRTGPRNLTVRLATERGAPVERVWGAVDRNLGTFFAAQGLAHVAVRHATEGPRLDERTGKFRQVCSGAE